jgi:hypothetical protein
MYHAILRGINRQGIFECDEDRIRFLEIISEVKGLSDFKLPGYCLMDNHDHLLTALRYICNNPVKAGLCKQADAYNWSSYRDYAASGGGGGPTDTGDILGMFSDDPSDAVTQFKEFMQTDADEAAERSDESLRERMEKLCGIKTAAQFQALSPDERDRNIRALRQSGMSIRRISRLTGVPFGVVRSR